MKSGRLYSFLLLFSLLTAAGAAGQVQAAVVTPPNAYVITINPPATTGAPCTQTVNGNSINWVPFSETNNDTVSWQPGAGYTSVNITFPNGNAEAPGTPFFDESTGNWLRILNGTNASASTPLAATLTVNEQAAARYYRFHYAAVTLPATATLPAVNCTFPLGGMGVQVTK
jgi:hypothetical protein